MERAHMRPYPGLLLRRASSRGIAGQNARDAPKGWLPLVMGAVYKQFDHLKSNC
jgi:hypothetical protein